MLRFFLIALSVFVLGSCEKACRSETKSAEQAVFFISPNNEVELSSPFEVKFGVKGMTVRPALEDPTDKTSGHHHILINHPKGFIEEGQAIPVDERHIHYGKGQESAMLELPPGKHTLSMQFADGAHLSYGEKMAATITVIVKNSTANH